MKKFCTLLTTALLCGICTTGFCDNSERIKELETEFKQTAEKRQAYMAEAQKCEVRLIEIQGAVKELTPKPEPKKEEKKNES